MHLSFQTSEAEEVDTEGQQSIQDDLSVAMKLGPWFNGKNHTIQTLDRQSNSRVFPTAVYLDKLDIVADGGKTPDVPTPTFSKQEVLIERVPSRY